MPKKEKTTASAPQGEAKEQNSRRTPQEILKDPTLTYEEWKTQLTEAYREQYLDKPEVVKLDEEIEALKKQITDSLDNVNGATDTGKLLDSLGEKQQVRKDWEEAADNYAKPLMFAAHMERQETEFAAEPQDLERGIKGNTLHRRHGEWRLDNVMAEVKDQTQKEPEEKEQAKKEAEEKEQPKKEAKEEPFDRDRLLEEAEKETEALRNNFDLPEEEWMQKMHKALERETLLREKDFDFDAQDKKTRELMDDIQKKRDALKEGDDRKPLEDAEKELGEHLKQTAKDRSLLAGRVENGYTDELRKRKEALQQKEKDLKQAGKGDTPEAEKLKASSELFGKKEEEAANYADTLMAEAQEPKENFFTNAFLKVFSGWLPQKLFSALGMGYGGAGARVVRVEQVKVEDPYFLPSFFSDKDALKPTGPDSTMSIFKGTELMKEKASEEILKADRNADLNFDGIDKAAKETAQRVNEQQENAREESVQKNAEQKKEQEKTQGFQIRQGPKLTVKDNRLVPVEALQEVPHGGEPMQEGQAKEEAKKEEPKKEEVKPGNKADLQPKKGSGLKLQQLQSVNHVEIRKDPALKEAEKAPAEEEATVQKQEEAVPENTAEVTETKTEAAKENTQEAKAVPLTNAQKANKLMGIFADLAGEDSKYHINSGKFKSMMDAFKKVQDTMKDTFGTLERDFGHLPNFKELSKPGGPLDLALKGPLQELEKKTEAYINEKTHNGIKTHMGSGLGNARLKDSLDALSILNPGKARELGENIRIDVKDGKASKRMNYNELNEKERRQEMKDMDKKKLQRMEIVGAKKKEKELLDRDPVMSAEEKSKRQGMRLK